LEPSANLVLVPRDLDDGCPSILKRLGFPFSASEATPDPDGRRRTAFQRFARPSGRVLPPAIARYSQGFTAIQRPAEQAYS
ncbi:hypothetical protein, partial [Salmonella enterica]|uniref:hypothetical protein n=1 Tax=Salmonella enterica TaxID=28901 RepID=UPI001F3FAADD